MPRTPHRRHGWRALVVTALPLVAATLLAALAVDPDTGGDAPSDGGATSAEGGDPAFVYVALGDSLTTAHGVTGPGATPQASWATGGNVSSIADRLRDHPSVTERVSAVNVAAGGARAADLPAQARLAAQQDPALVTVLMGANDACAEDADPVRFREDVRRAFTTLRDAAPAAAVVVYAFPDPAGLVDAWGTDRGARGTWAAFGTCPAFLAPDATPEDVDAASARAERLNAVLSEEAARVGFTFSAGIAEAGVQREDVSTWDFFHPSATGQARIAAAAWPTVDAVLVDR